MPEVRFNPRYAISSVLNPEPAWLCDLILDPFRPRREFGEAALVLSDSGRTIDMILIADRTLAAR